MEPASLAGYTYSATTNSKTESSAKEPKAPEGTLLRQVQDAKESILVLKNQVSFADQCLSLLHNQMKHASDTLAILQDQVELAQKTVNSLTEGSVAGLAIPNLQTSSASSTSTTSHPSRAPSESNSDEQRVIVHDSEGPKIYTLSKSSISLGNSITSDCSAPREHDQAPCVLHQVPMHCHCPVCLSHPSTSAPLVCHPTCHGPPGAVLVEVSPEIQPPPRPGSVAGADRSSAQAKGQFPSPTGKGSPSHEHGKDSSGHKLTSEKKESASTSPMAHQLLQVIDVLQTVDDDDDGSASRATTTSHTSLSHGVPGFQGTPYGQGVSSWHRVSRRNRKQNMSPVKVVHSHSLSQDKNSSGRAVIREHPELMRVPAPVLASTLEPEFLVVPTSSFSYDSPPTSASEEGGMEGVKTSSKSLLAKRTMTSSSQDIRANSSAVSSVTRTHAPGEGPCNTKEPLDKCKTDGCCSRDFRKNPQDNKPRLSGLGDAHGHVSHTPPSVESQRSDVTIDINGVSSPLSPKKRLFTGTSPLNSDVGMPFISKVQSSNSNSSIGRSDSVVTKVSSASEPVSLVEVVSHLEHAPEKPPVLSTSNHVTSSQSPSMNVISLPCAVETSAVSALKPTTPTTKKPIILSRRSSRSSEQNIPQGLVVLVPTIEDAKRLIASTGGQSDGHTPVLVPQHMLNEIHSKNTVTENQLETHSTLAGKRTHDVVSPPCATQSKRPAIDSVVID